MRLTKENLELFETVKHLCDNMELTENKNYYFLTLNGVESFNIQTIVDNAKYYESSVFCSYSYLDDGCMVLTFKKIEN